MQSTGQTSTQEGQPEHSSGTMTTSRPRSKIAPNSGGQLRRQVSQGMHSDASIRRGGFFPLALREGVAIRSFRAVRAGAEDGYEAGEGIQYFPSRPHPHSGEVT